MRLITMYLFFIGLIMNSAVQAQYQLQQKTVFCYSEKSLASYLDFAQKRNMEGLNLLVLAGKCNFVPDDQNLQISNYNEELIGKTAVISFNHERKTLWTFKRLMSVAGQ